MAKEVEVKPDSKEWWQNQARQYKAELDHLNPRLNRVEAELVHEKSKSEHLETILRTVKSALVAIEAEEVKGDK